MRKIFIFIALISSFTASADDLTFRMGQGYTNNTKSSIFSLEITKIFETHYMYTMSLGFWSDSKPYHESAFFSSLMIGRQFGALESLNFRALVGVAFISKVDVLLSTPFQFTEELNLGYGGFGVGIKHFSNAGIKTPNKGRDYLYLNHTIPF